MNPLILHLKQKYYWMIKHGQKLVEYREYKPYWISRIHGQKEIIFCVGYSMGNEWDIRAEVLGISIVGKKDLPEYVKEEFKKSTYTKFFEIKFRVKEKV